MDRLVTWSLKNRKKREQWEQFITENDLNIPTDAEYADLTTTFVLLDGTDDLVGTISRSDSVIKYVIACKKDNPPAGQRFNQLATAMIADLTQADQFHAFVFTKPDYQASFEHIGFQILAQNEWGALLEWGQPNINDYLATIPRPSGDPTSIGAIVMNANPFTKGHRALIERALADNPTVYVFVVSQDASRFTRDERFELVKAGTADLDGVIVVPGDAYMVSYLTFSAYFIQDTEIITRYQSELDATLFKEQIAPTLSITSRYVGTEPNSATTAQYNQALKKILPPKVAVVEVPRATTDDDQIISATTVRSLIDQGDLTPLAGLVPTTTADFIHQHLHDLQQRKD